MPPLLDYVAVCSASESLDFFEPVICVADEEADSVLLRKPVQGVISARLPTEDRSSDSPLPGNLWNFFYPDGLFLIRNSGSNPQFHPGVIDEGSSTAATASTTPRFLTLVLTEVDGRSLFVAGISFYWPLTDAQKQSAYALLDSPSSSRGPAAVASGGSQSNTAEASRDASKQLVDSLLSPVCICLLSHESSGQCFKRLLEAWYDLLVTGRPSHLPVERLLCSFLSDIPLPPLSLTNRIRLAICVPLDPRDAFFIPATGGGLPDSLCKVRVLFDCLGVSGGLRLIGAALHESKILLLAENPALANAVGEALCCLLHPFVWPYVRLTSLPVGMLQVLHAPTPFLLGMRPAHWRYAQAEGEAESLLDDSSLCLVDLDLGTVSGPQHVPSLLPDSLLRPLSIALRNALMPHIEHLSELRRVAKVGQRSSSNEDASRAAIGDESSESSANEDDSSRSEDEDVNSRTSRLIEAAQRLLSNLSAGEEEPVDSVIQENSTSNELAEDDESSLSNFVPPRHFADEVSFELLHDRALKLIGEQPLRTTDNDDSPTSLELLLSDILPSRELSSSERVDLEIRSCFVCFFALLLGDYTDSILYVRRFPHAVPVLDRRRLLDAAVSRVGSADVAPFLDLLFGTQAFAQFLENRHLVSLNAFDLATMNVADVERTVSPEREESQCFSTSPLSERRYGQLLRLVRKRMLSESSRQPDELYVCQKPRTLDLPETAVYRYVSSIEEESSEASRASETLIVFPGPFKQELLCGEFVVEPSSSSDSRDGDHSEDADANENAYADNLFFGFKVHQENEREADSSCLSHPRLLQIRVASNDTPHSLTASAEIEQGLGSTLESLADASRPLPSPSVGLMTRQPSKSSDLLRLLASSQSRATTPSRRMSSFHESSLRGSARRAQMMRRLSLPNAAEDEAAGIGEHQPSAGADADNVPTADDTQSTDDDDWILDREVVIADHPWQAEDDDELSFAAHQRIVVLERGQPDAWWLGELESGEIGLFPSGYTSADVDAGVEDNATYEMENGAMHSPASVSSDLNAGDSVGPASPAGSSHNGALDQLSDSELSQSSPVAAGKQSPTKPLLTSKEFLEEAVQSLPPLLIDHDDDDEDKSKDVISGVAVDTDNGDPFLVGGSSDFFDSDDRAFLHRACDFEANRLSPESESISSRQSRQREAKLPTIWDPVDRSDVGSNSPQQLGELSLSHLTRATDHYVFRLICCIWRSKPLEFEELALIGCMSRLQAFRRRFIDVLTAQLSVNEQQPIEMQGALILSRASFSVLVRVVKALVAASAAAQDFDSGAKIARLVAAVGERLPSSHAAAAAAARAADEKATDTSIANMSSTSSSREVSSAASDLPITPCSGSSGAVGALGSSLSRRGAAAGRSVLPAKTSGSLVAAVGDKSRYLRPRGGSLRSSYSAELPSQKTKPSKLAAAVSSRSSSASSSSKSFSSTFGAPELRHRRSYYSLLSGVEMDSSAPVDLLAVRVRACAMWQSTHFWQHAVVLSIRRHLDALVAEEPGLGVGFRGFSRMTSEQQQMVIELESEAISRALLETACQMISLGVSDARVKDFIAHNVSLCQLNSSLRDSLWNSAVEVLDPSLRSPVAATSAPPKNLRPAIDSELEAHGAAVSVLEARKRLLSWYQTCREALAAKVNTVHSQQPEFPPLRGIRRAFTLKLPGALSPPQLAPEADATPPPRPDDSIITSIRLLSGSAYQLVIATADGTLHWASGCGSSLSQENWLSAHEHRDEISRLLVLPDTSFDRSLLLRKEPLPSALAMSSGAVEAQVAPNSPREGTISTPHAASRDAPQLPLASGETASVDGLAPWSGTTGDIVISSSHDASVRVWEAASPGACRMVLRGHSAAVTDVDAHGSLVVTASYDHTLRLYDISVPDGRLVCAFAGHAAPVECCKFDQRNGKICVSGGRDNVVKVWDVRKQRLLHSLVGHTSWVSCIHLIDHKRLMLSGSVNGEIIVWDARTGKRRRKMKAESAVVRVRLDNDQALCLSALRDGRLVLWDVSDGSQLLQMATESTGIVEVEFGQHFYCLASNTLTVWPLQVGSSLPNGDSAGGSAAADKRSNGTSGSASSSASERSKVLRSPLMRLSTHTSVVGSCLDLSGDLLAVGSLDGTMRVWQLDFANLDSMEVELMGAMALQAAGLSSTASADEVGASATPQKPAVMTKSLKKLKTKSIQKWDPNFATSGSSGVNRRTILFNQ